MYTIIVIILTAAVASFPDVHPAIAIFVAAVTIWRASVATDKALDATGEAREKHTDTAVAAMVILFTCIQHLI